MSVNPAVVWGVCRGSRVHDGGWPRISVRGRAFWRPRVDRPDHDETAATEAIVFTARRTISPREVITPGWLDATLGGWEGGVRGDRPHETIHQILTEGALNAYQRPTMWTIAQGMAPLYPQLQRSHTLTGRPRSRNGELSPSCLKVRFLRSSHGDDHGSARRGDRRVRAGYLDQPTEIARTSRPVGPPGDVAPGSAIAHTR